MDFDYKSLLCFKKVAELEHMTRAAEQLYISQAQLSRIIQKLEKEFGVPLFERSGNSIRLNACGRSFYEYVQGIIDDTTTVQSRLRNLYLHEQSQLTLADNAAGYMVALTKMTREEFPELSMRQLSATSQQCVQYLKEGIADFAICCPGTEESGIERLFLKREEAVVIYPPGHWLSSRKSVSLAELADEPMIGMAEGFATRDSLSLMLDKYRFNPYYIVEISETTLVGYYVDAGIGISIVPKSLFTRNRFRNRCVQIEEPLYGDVYLLWKKGRSFSSDDEKTVQLIQDFFASI